MDNMRWRYNDTCPVNVDVPGDVVIEIGDLVYLKDEFLGGDRFLGVAMQRSKLGDMEKIRVATTGVFEFDCYVGAKVIGSYVAYLHHQKVSLTDNKKQRIGIVEKTTNCETVLVRIKSKVFK